MEGAQGADAAGALSRAQLPPMRLPREAKFLVGSALLLGALLVVPVPERSGASGNPALQEAARIRATELEPLAAAHPEIRRIVELLREGKWEEAVERLHEFGTKLEIRVLEAGGADAKTERLRDAVAEAAAGLGAQLAAAGRVIHAHPPALADRKLERQRARLPETFGPDPSEPAPPPGAAVPEAVLRSLASLKERPDWNPRYDGVIRRYLLGKMP